MPSSTTSLRPRFATTSTRSVSADRHGSVRLSVQAEVHVLLGPPWRVGERHATVALTPHREQQHGVDHLQRALQLRHGVLGVDGLTRLAEPREGEAVPGVVPREGLPPVVAAALREVLHGAGELAHPAWLQAAVDGVPRRVGALPRVEEPELVEQLGPAVGVEVAEELGGEAALVGDERVADLGGDDDAVLLDAGDPRGLLDRRRREPFPRQRGDERRVLVPKPEAVPEHSEALAEVEVLVLVGERRRRRMERLVELVGRRGGGRGEGELVVARPAADGPPVGAQDDGGGRQVREAAAAAVVRREGGVPAVVVARRRRRRGGGGVGVGVGEGEHGGGGGGDKGAGGAYLISALVSRRGGTVLAAKGLAAGSYEFGFEFEFGILSLKLRF